VTQNFQLLYGEIVEKTFQDMTNGTFKFQSRCGTCYVYYFCSIVI